jgi:polysaccharide chain length determinant protein (PEP-CTERM system associated)
MQFFKDLALRYLTGAWSYRWYGVALAWIICFAGWGAVAALPDQYRSEAKVYIDTESMMTPLLKGIAISADSDQQIAMMLKTFISRPNLEQVARISKPTANYSASSAELEQRVSALQKSITVRSLGIRNYYGISFGDNDPEYALAVTETLLSILMDSNIGDKRRDMEGARSFLDQQIANYEDRLRDAEKRRADFKSSNPDILGRGTAPSRLEAATVDVERARSELPIATARRDSLKALLASTPPTVASNDAVLIAMTTAQNAQPPQQGTRAAIVARIEQAKEQLKQMLLKYTEQHPDVVTLKISIAELEKELTPAPIGETATEQPPGIPNPVYLQLQAKLADEEVNVAIQRQRLNTALAEIEIAKRRMSDTIAIQTKYGELDRDYGTIDRTYQELLGRREAARVSQAVDDQSQSLAFRIIEAPQRSTNPSAPDRALLNSLVLLAGLGGGTAAAIFLSIVSGRIIVSDNLAAEFGVPLIGVVTKLRQITNARSAGLSAAALSVSVAMLLACYVGVLTVFRTSVYSMLGT